MQSEWTCARLESLGRIVTGKTPPTHDSSNFGGPIPFLTPSDFMDGHRRVLPARTLTQKGLSTVKGCLVPKGVAVSCIGWQMGKAVLVDEPTVTNQQINTIVPDEAIVDRSYLFYALTSIRSKIFELGATSTRTPIVNKTTFGSIEIALPPVEYQQSVAEVVGAIDDRIDLLRQTNATLESIAQALFKSWFIDFDPVRAKAEGREPEGMDAATAALFPAEFEESALGLIPNGWTVGDIYEVADVRYGAPFASKLFNTDVDGLPLVRIRDLKDEAPGVWTPEAHPKGCKIRPGDIVVGMDGEFRAYLWGGEVAWMNQRICMFSPTNGHSAAFVRSAIAAPLAHVEATETATTVIHLGKADIDRFRIVVPTPAVARAFGALCQPLYDRIVAGKQAMRSLGRVRDTLLPRLISGKLRLPEAQSQLEEAIA